MAADPFSTEGPAPDRGDTAPIRAVTAEMMEGAARQAARLADGVAHHADPRGDHPTKAADDSHPLADAPSPSGPVAAAPAPAVVDDAAAAGGGVDARANADPGLLRSVATLQRYNSKLLDICKDNVAATGAFLTALMDVKTVPEALQVNADHMTRGFQALTGQSRELAELAQRIAFDALRPFGGPRGEG